MFVGAELQPAFKGIDSILVSGAVMLDGGGIAATGHETTRLLVRDEFIGGPRQWPWALANPYGDGHVVVIGGNVTHDTLVDRCPDNARWLSNLLELLYARTREMAGWLTRPDDARQPVSVALEELLDVEESQTLERKSSFLVATENDLDTSKVQHKVGRAIASLANTDGGWLIIGQDDHGNRLGLGRDFAKCKSQSRDGFLLKFKQYVTANVNPSWEALRLGIHWIEEPVGQILIVNVPRSSRPVWVRKPENRSKSELFVRRATITEALEGPDLVDWIATRG